MDGGVLLGENRLVNHSSMGMKVATLSRCETKQEPQDEVRGSQ